MFKIEYILPGSCAAAVVKVYPSEELHNLNVVVPVEDSLLFVVTD